MSGTTSITILRGIEAVLAGQGIDGDGFLDRLGLTRATLEDDDARVLLSRAAQAWTIAAELAHDDAFGLHFAERVPKGTLTVYEYVLRASATVAEALTRMLRYQRLVHEGVEVTVTTEGQHVRLEHHARSLAGGSPRHAVEAAVATWVVQIRLLAGPMTVRLVSFRHARPREIAEHSRVFGVVPTFASDSNALVFDREVLDRPIVTRDPALLRLLEREADRKLSARLAPSVSERVVAALAAELPGGDPRLKKIAATLSLNVRTLQRQLATDGTSFAALVEQVRRDGSERLLGEGRPLGEIAWLLGFSEPSAFHRAYQRWTGTTPGARRRRRE